VDGTSRAEKKSGLKDWIVLKQDQRCGKFIEGIVKDILTKSPIHPHGMHRGAAGDRSGRPSQEHSIGIVIFWVQVSGECFPTPI
jgi:uncharacterized repeat protein (TIGR03833 family)